MKPVNRLLTVTLSAAALVGAAAVPAAAGPPGEDDNWTFLRDDGYRHYACKYRFEKGERWRVKTASIAGKRVRGTDIDVYAAIARGSNRNLVSERTAKNEDLVRMTFRGLKRSDRLWIQAAAYGPAEPWSDGDRVGGLKRCTDIR